MRFTVHLMLGFHFLFLRASKSDFYLYTQANVMTAAVCKNIEFIGSNLDPKQEDIESDDIDDQCFCLLYPTNILNCSWSLDHLAVAHISVCDNETLFLSLNTTTEESVGLASLILRDIDILYVVLRFNLTLQGNWAVYTKVYDKNALVVPPPPGNISTSVMEENLLVSWALPASPISFKPSCYDYQLDIGGREPARNITDTLSYELKNVDIYRVRMRAQLNTNCHERPHWSEWSKWSKLSDDTVSGQKPPAYHLNLLVIVLILLGLPMILLAILLLARSQRLYKTVFPPIPCPPPKYMNFLEKNSRLNNSHPCTQVEDEAIAVVTYVSLTAATKANMSF